MNNHISVSKFFLKLFLYSTTHLNENKPFLTTQYVIEQCGG